MPASHEPVYVHYCEDGHHWKQQPDGGVSPSWGAGGTSVTWPGYDPLTCPEPKRDREGRYRCAGCGGRFYASHGTSGVMSDPWNYDERCRPPEPACGKPPTQTFVWVDGNRRRGEATGWLEVTPGQQLELGVDVTPGDATFRRRR